MFRISFVLSYSFLCDEFLDLGMAGKDDLEYPYEASDEASESELLDRSLSVWSGPSSFGGDDFTPVALDLHTASSIGHYGCVRSIIEKWVIE